MPDALTTFAGQCEHVAKWARLVQRDLEMLDDPAGSHIAARHRERCLDEIDTLWRLMEEVEL
jgi:hypothetical protein